METVYIAGKIAGDPDSRKKFRAAAERETGIVLDPSVLPRELPEAKAMRVCFAMIDAADRAVFLPDFPDSPGAMLELQYCRYIKKPVTLLSAAEEPEKAPEPPEEQRDPPSETHAEPAAEDGTKNGAERSHSEFLFLRCSVCGAVRAFCARTPTRLYLCPACGGVTELGALTRAYTACECGNRARYETNLEDRCFDIPCVACGSPCPVEYSPAKNIFVPIGIRGRKTRSPKKGGKGT